MYEVGEIIKFNLNVPNKHYSGVFCVVEEVLVMNSKYFYRVRYLLLHGVLVHGSGTMSESWLDKI